MDNFFESPFRGITLDKQVTNPNIVVGRYSYYSGYYHGHGFDDCARYLLLDKGADRLIIGSFCSIGSGAAFIMAGNQGHRNDWISSFPFYWMPEVAAFEGAANGYRPAKAATMRPAASSAPAPRSPRRPARRHSRSGAPGPLVPRPRASHREAWRHPSALRGHRPDAAGRSARSHGAAWRPAP